VQTYRIKSLSASSSPKALIYGAGEIGMQLVRQHFRNRLQYSIVGFIDDNPIKKGAMINGIRVLGDINQMPDMFRVLDVQVLIIGITNLSGKKMKEALDIAERFGVDVKIIPSLFEMETKKKNVADIRSINFEDLIGRSPVTLDREPIKHMVSGKRILVTGAGGSIGSEICRQLLEYDPAKLCLLDIDETELHDLSLRLHNYKAEFSDKILPIVCDVRDKDKVELIFASLQPEIVFHAAALKHVPMMEYYPEEAVKTNIMGTYNVLKSAVSNKVDKCIVISTDKAVNPTNVMGATKRVSEQIARMLNTPQTQIVAVRFGNVLGSRGSMLPLFLEQMNNGLSITVTDKNIIRYFMTIAEAVSLVFQAGALASGGEVMVLEMGDPVNIYDFAQKLVKYFGDGRSEVIISGLRPGEKLYEEKLSDLDNTIPTGNPKVYKAKVNGIINEETFIQFYQSIHGLTPEEIVKKLQEFVPEFTRPGQHIIG
jgi:FlaA1/EpsC-like NDP-sugar epimerase